jgi:hypothetical protein
MEGEARRAIREAVLRERESAGAVAHGIAGGASGGDILFHEVCQELGIPTRLYLAVPPRPYIAAAVQAGGEEWVGRFWQLYQRHQYENTVRVLSETGDEPEALPAWLRSKPDYTVWQRVNLWMLFNALDEASDPKSADPNITLIALWDGQPGDGPGVTADLVGKVEKMGARVISIQTRALLGAGGPS